MSDIKIQPSATGSATVTLTAPVTNTARTITFPDSTSTLLASDGSGANLTNLPLSGYVAKSGGSNGIMTGMLTINSADTSWRGMQMIRDTDTGSSAAPYLTLWNGNETGSGNTGLMGRLGILNGDEFAVHSVVNYPMTFRVNESEKMRIDTNGRLGIGTTSPSNALHVHSGGTALNTWFQSTHANTCQIQLSTATNNSYARITNVAAALKYESDITGDNADSGHQFLVDGTMKGRIDGDGLKFNTDTAAANALHDYEEGNWTPVFTGTSGSAGSFNTGEWNGRYTKIGRMVTCVFTTTLSNKGSWGGEVRITGLPYTPIITMPCSGSLRLAYVNFAGGSVGGLSCHITSGQTYIRCIYSQDNDVSTVVQVSECTNTSVFSGEFTFMIA